jgi:hypothetical protein
MFKNENSSVEIPVGGLALKDLLPGMIVCIDVDPGTDDAHDPDTFPWEVPPGQPVYTPKSPTQPATEETRNSPNQVS